MKLHEIMDNSITHILEAVKRDCGPYLNVLKNTNGEHPLYRGSDSSTPKHGSMNIIEPRMMRKPKSIPLYIHDQLNKLLEERFGYHFRNAIFTTSNLRDAALYGRVGVVFPIGKLNYVWNTEYRDLYYAFEHWDDLSEKELINDEHLNAMIHRVVDLYSNKNISRAITTGYEVLLANKCYMVSLKDYEELKPELFR
jgi:hypothetical protein